MHKRLSVDPKAKYDDEIFNAAKGTESVTTDVIVKEYGDIMIYDTPGFDDPKITDTHLWNKTISKL